MPPIKVTLVGDTGTGKTRLFQFLTNTFTKRPVVTCACYVGTMSCPTSIQLWDTPGGTRFRTILKAPLRGASIVLLVFDIEFYTVKKLDYWVELAYTYNSTHPGIIVVINNCTANTMIPTCPYKVFLINTKTGYNMKSIKSYIESVCRQIIPMTYTDSVHISRGRGWLECFRCY